MRVWVLTGDKLETAVNIGNPQQPNTEGAYLLSYFDSWIGYASKQLVSGMEIMTISDQATITVCVYTYGRKTHMAGVLIATFYRMFRGK